MHPYVDRPDRLDEACESTQVARRLQDLPAELQPPYDWPEFQRRAQERRRATPRKVARPLAAAAAVFIAIVAGIAYWSRASSPEETHRIVRSEPPAMPAPPEDLLARAMASERWLSRLPPEPAIVRVDTRMAVTELEDRIAWLDELITTERLVGQPSPRINALQTERARLVNSLAQVRYVETLANEYP